MSRALAATRPLKGRTWDQMGLLGFDLDDAYGRDMGID